jgi:PPIC-type PPIASE domain
MKRCALRSALGRVLRDPLLHFLALGALLFGGYALLHRGPAHPDTARQVVIGAGEVRWLTETWSRQWRREPTPEELRDLIAGLVREELLARAAREMRLEQDDVIVRRRLAQKVEFVLRDTAVDREPTEAELQRFYAEHPERFRVEARRSFTQVLFSSSRPDARRDAMRALHRLLTGPPPATDAWGDPQLLPEGLRDADERTVQSAFGPEFAREVFLLESGRWSGPIASPYGQHLVRVEAASPARQPDLADVRGEVLELWRAARGREREARYLADLGARYGVVLDDAVRRMLGPLPVTPPIGTDAP